ARRAARLERARRCRLARGSRGRTRARGRATGVGSGTGTRRGARSPAGPDATLRDRVPARPRGGPAAAARTRVAVPRRRRTARSRRAFPRPPYTAGSGRARPLSLLHRLHPRDATGVPRARGGGRRWQPARAQPILGRGAGALPARRCRPVDAASAAVTAHVAARVGADRTRTAARGRTPSG